MKNKDLAVLFDRIADALDIKGEQAFKVLAYRRAARILDEMTDDVAQIAAAGRRMGYSYIAVCDHSQCVKYARGLSPDRLRRQMKEIDALNRSLKPKRFRLLKGTEVDILADGRLDFPDALLKELDFVVAAIHSGFKKNVTERILKAMENPYVKVIAHPTGREGYDNFWGAVASFCMPKSI